MSRRRHTCSEPTQPNPTIHVEISAGGHQVIIEAPTNLDDIAAKALQLWQSTDGPGATGSGDGQVSIGFTVISDPVDGPLMGPESTLPSRLIPDQETQDDRRDN